MGIHSDSELNLGFNITLNYEFMKKWIGGSVRGLSQ